MKNYYITKNNEKIEILDKEEINLSGYKIANKKIKEIHITTSLIKCKELYLQNNCLTEFNADLPGYKIATGCIVTNCKKLHLYENYLTEFKAVLPNVEYLDLENNCLTSFNANLPNCERLYLRNNSLTIFNADLPNCKTLDLRNNNLLYKRLNNNVIFYI